MASSQFAADVFFRRRISLAEIDAAVSARLGPTRGLGNSQPACFNRQVGMYLARHVSRWTTVIGRFYNGRDHSTVCYGIQRIESLRESDPDVDVLIVDLRRQLMSDDNPAMARVNVCKHHSSTALSQPDLQIWRIWPNWLQLASSSTLNGAPERRMRKHKNSKTPMKE
jgi:hypothetical protein